MLFYSRVFDFVLKIDVAICDIFRLENIVSDNTINILTDGDEKKVAFKGWAHDMDYKLYACYSCEAIFKDLEIVEVDNSSISVNNRKMTYYMYNENITLSEISLNRKKMIFYKAKPFDERIVGFDYSKLDSLTPEEEWAIKRALYFDGSYYAGATGKLQYGVIGGTMPYNERIYGTSEYLRNDGSLEMVDGVDSTFDGSIFPINTKEIAVPTKKWLDDFTDEYGYVYEKTPYNITIKDKNNVVPYIAYSPSVEDDKFSCDESTPTTPPNPWLDNNTSGYELTKLIE